jgi:RNA polymerase sigma-70 factor (ECF subfamily)
MHSVDALENEDDHLAFQQYYEQHKGRCLAIALAITRNHAWAEDAVQDAFLKILRNKGKYFPDLRKKAGLQIVIMVKCAAIDILRKEKRLAHAALDDCGDVAADTGQDVVRAVVSDEAAHRLRHHVSQLDEVNQAVFEMKCLGGMTDGEIAAILGLSENAVATRFHRMRKKLSDKLKAEGYIDG